MDRDRLRVGAGTGSVAFSDIPGLCGRHQGRQPRPSVLSTDKVGQGRQGIQHAEAANDAHERRGHQRPGAGLRE